MQINNTDEFIKTELQKLYDAERQLVETLPILADKAQDTGLKEALMSHLEQTKNQMTRLEEVMPELKNGIGTSDRVMSEILDSGQELIENVSDRNLKDMAIIGGSEKVEHYEMAAYESVISLAKKFDKEEIADILGETLKEEKMAAEKLKIMSNGSIGKTIAGLM